MQHFPAPKTYLVRDPNSSLVPGDVVRISSGNPSSKAIKHAVTTIVAPFGEPVENRPPVLSQAQLDEQRVHKRLLKDVRSAQRGRQASIQRLQQARKQGLEIPTLEEALKAGKEFEEELKSRGRGQAKEASQKGQEGQQLTSKQRRMEEGKRRKEEARAEEKARKARQQTS